MGPARRYELLHWTPEMVERFWDWQSGQPESYFAAAHAGALLRRLRPHLAADAAVLDYGCGPGDLIAALLDAGFRAAGVDASAATREAVARRFAGRAGFLGALAPDELGARRFAAVSVLEVIEHLYDEPLDALLATLRRVLEPGGLVLLSTPNEEDLERSYVLCPVTGQLFHRYQHVRSWSRATLVSHLEPRGFEVVSAEATDLRLERRDARALWRRGRRALSPGRKPPPHLVAIARSRPPAHPS
jgi:SAM-dependent methyltransferase